jgi:hypothetical protein
MAMTVSSEPMSTVSYILIPNILTVFICLFIFKILTIKVWLECPHKLRVY